MQIFKNQKFLLYTDEDLAIQVIALEDFNLKEMQDEFDETPSSREGDYSTEFAWYLAEVKELINLPFGWQPSEYRHIPVATIESKPEHTD